MPGYSGPSIVEEVTLYKVQIEGRGGDSVHNEHFETQSGAIFASALDGQDFMPTSVRVLRFSDGTYGKVKGIGVSTPPTEEQVAGLLTKGLTPAQQLLLEEGVPTTG